MPFLTRARVRGYLVASSVGLAIGLVVDSVDLEVLMKKKNKALEIVSAITLLVGAVTVAYNEPPPSNPKDGQARSPSEPHD